MSKSIKREINWPATLTIIGIVVVIVIIILAVCIRRVDPGNVGIVIDYGKGTTSGQASYNRVATGSYLWLNPVTQKLAEYPISQQTLSMVKSEKEGQVIGNDSVSCQDKNGIPLSMDASIIWRVDPEQAGSLYMLRPGIKLIGSFGSDIESTIVRREARSAMSIAATEFTYDGLFATEKIKYVAKVKELLRAALSNSFVILDDFVLGEIYVPDDQMKAIQAKAIAQQDAEKAAYLKQQKENEADGAVAEAEGQRLVKIKQAEAESESIKIIQQQLAQSPDYVKYIYAKAWNGVMPGTVVIASDGQVPPVILPQIQ